MTPSVNRKLAAIMVTDIANFSSMSSRDEKMALNLLETQRTLLHPIITSFSGVIHKETGDGLLITFSTVSEALECGIEIQKRTDDVSNLDIRIGIHEGEISVRGDDVLGDDINIAHRIEPFASEGGIAISGKVEQNISSLPEYETSYIGTPKLKGINKEIKIFCIISHGLPQTKIKDVSAKLEPKTSHISKIYGIGSLIIAIIAIVLFKYTDIYTLFLNSSNQLRAGEPSYTQLDIQGATHSPLVLTDLSIIDSLFKISTIDSNTEAIALVDEILLVDSTKSDFFISQGQLYYQRFILTNKKNQELATLAKETINLGIDLKNANKTFLCRGYITLSDIYIDKSDYVNAKNMLRNAKAIDYSYPGIKQRNKIITRHRLSNVIGEKK